jgi:hypothetical protein
MMILVSVCSVQTGRGIAVAQSPISTATPDPAVVNLQAQVSTQATQIANLESQVDNEIRELRIEVRENDLLWKVVAAAIPILGLPTVLVVCKYVRDKAKKLIDKAIYKVDPVNAVIHVPGSGFDQELQHLKWRGFYKFRPYQWLDNTCLEDCVVVVAKNEDDISNFRAFLEKYSPDSEKVAYVIYTQLRVPPDIVDDFPNITFANSIVTLGTNLFTIARSLIK